MEVIPFALIFKHQGLELWHYLTLLHSEQTFYLSECNRVKEISHFQILCLERPSVFLLKKKEIDIIILLLTMLSILVGIKYS